MKGFIRPRGKGFTAYWSTTDGNGQRHQHTKGGFRTQGDAQKYLNGILPQVDQGKGRPDRRMTVEQLLTDWLAAKASEGLKPCTVGMYRNVVNGWVIRYVGGLRVDQLTPSRAAQLVETLRSPAGSSLGRGGLQPRSTGPPVPEGLHPVGSRNGSDRSRPAGWFQAPEGSTVEEGGIQLMDRRRSEDIPGIGVRG